MFTRVRYEVVTFCERNHPYIHTVKSSVTKPWTIIFRQLGKGLRPSKEAEEWRGEGWEVEKQLPTTMVLQRKQLRAAKVNWSRNNIKIA